MNQGGITVNTNNYLVIDTEHGGFLEGEPLTLLEAYLGVFNSDFQFIEDLTLKVRPENGLYEVQGEALGVNKIDLYQHDKEAMTFKEARPMVFDLIHRNSNAGASKLIPVGHNVAGDIALIRKSIISRGAWRNHVSYRVVDSSVVAQFLKLQGKLPMSLRGSLGELCKHLGVKLDNAHTAKADAVASALAVKEMLKL